MKSLTYFALFTLCFMSCQDSETQYHVEPELEKYVESFLMEASKRGKTIERRNLIVEVADNVGAAGRSFREGDQRIIRISNNTLEWMMTKEQPEWAIENLMYHELGHALLGRKHCDPKYSIMASGLSFFAYQSDSLKRKVLVDELFNEHFTVSKMQGN